MNSFASRTPRSHSSRTTWRQFLAESPRVFRGAERGEEIPDAGAVSFGLVLLQVELPFLQHELFQEVFDQVLDLLGEPL